MKKILVVDDKPNNLSLVTSLIKPYYEVLLANSGERALLIAREKIPDMILLDIMMPDLSGFEVCQQLKKKEDTADIPVIFLTARTSGDDFEKAYEMGGVDYITKPINTKELLARIKTHLLISEQRKNLQSLNRDIAALNSNLEVEVQKRTAELKKAVSQLEKQNSELEQVSYVISHNLRGPVASILGLSKLFNPSNPGDPINNEIFEHLTTATQSLDEIVHDLSAIVNIRNNKTPEFEKTDIGEIIQNAREKLQKDIQASNTSLEIKLSSTPELMVVKSYMEDIMCHLLSNAILYRSKKTPEIKIYMEKENGAVNIYVKDNGIGIDKKDWEKIFDPFKRLSLTGKGKGLGLYLVKNQIEALHGKISVEHSSEEGTTFLLSFPTIHTP